MSKRIECPKCGALSGDDWRQCNGTCPMPMSPFWKSVGELAAMRDDIPKERREMSGVREFLRRRDIQARDEADMPPIVEVRTGENDDARVTIARYVDGAFTVLEQTTKEPK